LKTTTIREPKHSTSTVLGWVATGESVEVRRCDRPSSLPGPGRDGRAGQRH
jgi:antitoxin (DNA-binding transcriptional repressor) of toxin-antitoxin stability system